MKRLRLADVEDVVLEIPSLGVSVCVDAPCIIALARKAHENRRQKSRSGPCEAIASGPLPDRFQNRYSVHTESTREKGHSKSLSLGGAFKDKAEARYAEEIASGKYSYVALWGPTSPQSKGVIVLKEHGKKGAWEK